jgi:hypothetical protein
MSKPTEIEALKTTIYEAIGEGSMCWTERPTGIFESEKAKAAGDRILAAVEAIRTDRDNLRRFIEELVSTVAWGNEIRFPEDMDGTTVQDLAEHMGILKPVDHPEPCSVENCPCIENGPFDYLYHFAWSMPEVETDADERL